MQGERGLVRDNARPLGPEPGGDQLLMLARGELDEPVDPPPRSGDPAGADVLQEQLG